MSNSEELEIVRGSGNVFKDHGHEDADVQQMKGILAAQIIELLDSDKLSVRAASKLTGFAAADFSRVRNADLGRFSVDRLVRMVNRLDEDMEVTLSFVSRTHRSETAFQM